MTTLDQLRQQPIKLLIVGDPGAGKTGSTASLVNKLGMKLKVINFDGNIRPLLDYVDEDKKHLVDVFQFEDKMRVDSRGGISFSGAPESPAGLAGVLAGAEEWGLDTCIVIDPISHLTELTLKKSAGGGEAGIQDYGALKDEFLALLWYLKKHIPCHVVCLDHLSVPAETIDMRSKSERVAAGKTAAPEGSWKATVAWKRFPATAGKALQPLIGGFFDLVLHAKVVGAGRGARRVLSMVPDPDVDVKAPTHLFDGKVELPVEDGLATFFSTLSENGVKEHE